MDDDHNRLCDVLTKLALSVLPEDEKHNTKKLHKLSQFMLKDTDLAVKIAALILLANQ